MLHNHACFRPYSVIVCCVCVCVRARVRVRVRVCVCARACACVKRCMRGSDSSGSSTRLSPCWLQPTAQGLSSGSGRRAQGIQSRRAKERPAKQRLARHCTHTQKVTNTRESAELRREGELAELIARSKCCQRFLSPTLCLSMSAVSLTHSCLSTVASPTPAY